MNLPTPAPAPRMPLARAGALALGLAALSDFLFFGQPVGWTLALIHWLLLACALAAHPRALQGRPCAVLASIIAFIGFSFVLEPNPIALLLAVIGLISLPWAARAGWTADARVWARRWGATLALGWAAPLLDAGRAARVSPDPRAFAQRGARAALGWFVPLLFTSVFLMAFSAANPVIGQWRETLGIKFRELWSELLFGLSGRRFCLWAAVFCCVWALVRPRLWKIGMRAPGPPLRDLPAFISPAVVVRSLVLFNAAFLLQTSLDSAYLWAGAALPAGMTYAEYAHRGAYTLVATALLAAVFVIAVFHPGGAAERSPLARQLVYLWLAQNVFLMFSSLWRLHLYVDAYALTRFRVAAALWMLLVACGLALILARIRLGRTNQWLLAANSLAAAALLYACAFLDINGAIARHNVSNSRELRGGGPALDFDYLRRLGPAALPSLALLPRESAAAAALRRELNGRLAHDTRNWRGWTLRRQAWANAPRP